jgi:hypothetical protein
MALCSDAVMAIYYDFAEDPAGHDDWHTYEHMHERLSIPGFVRGTRWVAKAGSPRYMIVYEVTGIDVATSDAYLARLNDPSPWTRAIMANVRGMVRGCSTVVGSSGFGLGNEAMSIRFSVTPQAEARLVERFARDVLPSLASRRGMAGAHLLKPAAPAPMTKEQSLRGTDTPMTWLLLATAYDSDALSDVAAQQLRDRDFARRGAEAPIATGTYALHFTLTAGEAARSAPNPPLQPSPRGDARGRR